MAKHLDESDARFLQTVAKHGGSDVTTTTIRRETGFSPEKTRYRFGKLEETGHILVSYAEQSAGPGDSPRTATLTDKGRQTLDTLTVEARSEPVTPEEYGERLLELERQVRLLADAVDRLESFEEDWNDDLWFFDDVCTAVVRTLPRVQAETKRVNEESSHDEGE